MVWYKAQIFSANFQTHRKHKAYIKCHLWTQRATKMAKVVTADRDGFGQSRVILFSPSVTAWTEPLSTASQTHVRDQDT